MFLPSSPIFSEHGFKKISSVFNITFIVLFTFHGSGCSNHHEQDTTAKQNIPMFIHQNNQWVVPDQSPLRKHLKVAAISSGSAVDVMSYPGTIEANTAQSANIEAPLTGRLISLHVKLGDRVHKGQVLAEISSGDLAQARSDLVKARDSLKLADQQLKRAQGVNEIGASATKDLEVAQSSRIQAKAEYDRATERLNTLLGGATQTTQHSASNNTFAIIAPVSGEITALNIGLGSYINDNTSSLMTISNLDQVWITASIPESQLENVHAGLPVEITLPAYPNQILHGHIDSIANILDNDTRRAKARIIFDNPSLKLKPNMFVNVQIQHHQTGQIRIPLSALLMNNDSVTVFVEVRPNTYVRKSIEIGNEDEQYAQVLSGLNPNDRIVVSGGVLLND